MSLQVVADPVVGVRAAALRALGRVLATVRTLPVSDAKIFNECAPLECPVPRAPMPQFPACPA